MPKRRAAVMSTVLPGSTPDTHSSCPSRGGHRLHRGAVAVVLAAVPVLLAGELRGDPFGGDVHSVHDQVVPAGLDRQTHHLGQRQRPPRQHLDALLHVGVAGAARDAVAFGQATVGVPTLQIRQRQHRL
jgi:hypothetical protein